MIRERYPKSEFLERKPANASVTIPGVQLNAADQYLKIMEKTQPRKHKRDNNHPPEQFSLPHSGGAPNAEDSGLLPYPPEPLTEEKVRAISRFCKERRIYYLTHFTRLENLTSILMNGLIPQASLRMDAKFSDVKFNRPQLPSAWQWAISLNISFPNYRLFYNLQERLGYEWTVLLFDIDLLLDLPFYFFPYPAVSLIPAPHFQKEISPFLQHPLSLEKLFADTENVRRADLEIPDSYPTNPQSEVLTFAPIPMQYLREVHFYNDYKFNQWFLQNMELALSVDKKIWRTGLTYFSPRSDYIHWKSRFSR